MPLYIFVENSKFHPEGMKHFLKCGNRRIGISPLDSLYHADTYSRHVSQRLLRRPKTLTPATYYASYFHMAFF